ncbi:helix-turn-helix domain-containing protein [Parasutterella muris]|uniref:Helix-turn-helix domain-containing protein n=1 Tax=Parasutterella muris TaxID=2565572 RepID=A0A6L6YDT8_9BURK|nr:helix-turn-helix domain-containing protein [Parasutterella muris]MVX55627.1 helix-turn-helix domain-containing protein [Parasutterella muris]
MEFNGAKIKEFADKKGISMYALAKGTGLTQATLSRIVNCKIEKPRDKTLIAIADFLGVSPRELGLDTNLEGTKVERGPVVPVYSPRELARFVRGDKQQEPTRLITYPFTDTEDADDVLLSDFAGIVNSELLCLRVCGLSASPLYEDGDLVFIKYSELDDIPVNGEERVAVCLLGDKENEYAAIRRISADESSLNDFWARPINPDYPDQTVYQNPLTIGTIVGFIGKPRSIR